MTEQEPTIEEPKRLQADGDSGCTCKMPNDHHSTDCAKFDAEPPVEGEATQERCGGSGTLIGWKPQLDQPCPGCVDCGKRCPTCGSDDPKMCREQPLHVFSGYNNPHIPVPHRHGPDCCGDPFHQPPVEGKPRKEGDANVQRETGRSEVEAGADVAEPDPAQAPTDHEAAGRDVAAPVEGEAGDAPAVEFPDGPRSDFDPAPSGEDGEDDRNA